MRGHQNTSQPSLQATAEANAHATLDRRDFFKAAGLSSASLAAAGLGLSAVAATLSGCASTDASNQEATQDSPDETYSLYGSQSNITFAHTCDVLIIGSGIAGLSAALPLAQAGKSVIVAEKLDLLGGAAVNSSGLMFVAGTELQMQAGLTQTPEEAWEQRVKVLKSMNIPHLERARELFLGATEWVNILAEQCGSAFANPAEYWTSATQDTKSDDTQDEASQEGAENATNDEDAREKGSVKSAAPETEDAALSSDQTNIAETGSADESSNNKSASNETTSSESTSSDTATDASNAIQNASSMPSFLLPNNGIGSMINVMSPLRDTLTSLGVVFLTSHQAKAFIVNSKGEKRGMRFLVNKPDTTVDIKAQRIIFATGGFSSSPNFVHKYAPTWDQTGVYSYSQTGDGQRICSEADIALSGMEEHVYLTGDIPWTDAWIYFGPTLIVSALGQRFAREDVPVAAAETCFKDNLGYWWTIFDNQLVKSSQGRSMAELVNKHPQQVIGPVDSKEELAKAMGLAESSLDQAFSDYEAMVKAGTDATFGRTDQLVALNPPFYAVKQRPVRFASVGGISTDDAGHVLTGMGVLSKNVYACGAVADGGGEGIASCGACGLMVGRTVLADLG